MQIVMSKRKRRNHPPSFKAKVALAALQERKSMVELGEEYDVHPNQVQEWKKRLINEAEQLFRIGNNRDQNANKELLQELHAKIGELTMERDSLSKALGRNK